MIKGQTLVPPLAENFLWECLFIYMLFMLLGRRLYIGQKFKQKGVLGKDDASVESPGLSVASSYMIFVLLLHEVFP